MQSQLVKIKGLSVNIAFKGRKVRTHTYNKFRKEIAVLLPREIDFNFGGEVTLLVEFGVSNRASDIDNLLKTFIDALQTQYPAFNDKQIYRLEVDKAITKKGYEYIKFKFIRF